MGWNGVNGRCVFARVFPFSIIKSKQRGFGADKAFCKKGTNQRDKSFYLCINI